MNRNIRRSELSHTQPDASNEYEVRIGAETIALCKGRHVLKFYGDLSHHSKAVVREFLKDVYYAAKAQTTTNWINIDERLAILDARETNLRAEMLLVSNPTAAQDHISALRAQAQALLAEADRCEIALRSALASSDELKYRLKDLQLERCVLETCKRQGIKVTSGRVDHIKAMFFNSAVPGVDF